MNRIPWNLFFLIPLFFFIALIALLSLVYALRDRHKFHSAHKDRLYRCGICGHVYMDARMTGLARCPRCGCLNEPLRR